MRYPKNLPANGTIGFVAPSFGCATEPYRSAFLSAQESFSSLGFQLMLGPNCYCAEGVGISNLPSLCGEEINTMYTSSANDCLISCGGGELMCEVLDYIDFPLLKKAPAKWFMGFSDNTNLAFLLPTLCDTASIYGPCAPAFGMEPWHPVLEDALGILMGETHHISCYGGWESESLKDEDNPTAPYNITETTELKYYPEAPVRMSGRLIGGCLDCLANLCGTKYDRVQEFCEKYKEDGFIWFMESCDLNVFGIRRALWELSRAGWFSHVKGFLIGRPYCFGEEIMGLDAYEAVLSILAPYNVPIIMDVDLGHLPPSMPLVNGAPAIVTAEGNELNIEMSFR